jgi:hypothetical protein
MAFDLGFNFRATAPYVTDQSYAVPALGEAYPHTYTASNGYSVNAGWDNGSNVANRSASNDARIAGIFYFDNSAGANNFKVDLSSGSAPGAGDYAIDLAAGDNNVSQVEDVQVRDTTTVLIDMATAPGDFVTSGGTKYFDATKTERTATTTWNGVTVTKTFATTLAQLTVALPIGAGGFTCIAHFRLTLASSTTNYTLPVSSGVFTLAGQDATLTNTPLSTLGGSLLLLGLQYVRPATAPTLLAATGAFTVTPWDVALTFQPVQITMPVSSGVFTLAGSDAQFTQTHTFPVTTGAFTLTGQDATFTQQQHIYAMAAATGAFALTGPDAGLVFNHTVPVPPLPSVSGRSPYLEYRRHRRTGR